MLATGQGAANRTAGDTFSAPRQANRPDSVHAEPIDLRHLGRYTLGDAVLEREVLGLFAGQLPETIEALKYSANNQEWMAAAHTLKGSSRAVGAWLLADLALQAERNAGIPLHGASGGTVLTQIEDAAADVVQFIKTLRR